MFKFYFLILLIDFLVWWFFIIYFELGFKVVNIDLCYFKDFNFVRWYLYIILGVFVFGNDRKDDEYCVFGGGGEMEIFFFFFGVKVECIGLFYIVW